MKPTNRIALSLLLPFLVLSACSKEKKAEPDKAVATASDTVTATKDEVAGAADMIALVPTAASAELASILKYMPIDTEILVAVNLVSLTGTPLWNKLGPAAIAKAGASWDNAKATCGFNPVLSLSSVHLGFNSKGGGEPVIIAKGLSRKPLVACIEKLVSQRKDELEVSEEGNFTIVKGKKDGESQTVIWLDDTTLLLVPGKADKAYLQARFDGKDNLAGNADILFPAAKANQSSPIWFAGKFGVSSKAAKKMASMGSQPKALYGSVAFVDGVQFSLGVTFENEEGAKSTLGQVKAMMGVAKGSLGALAGLVDKTQLTTDGSDLKLSLNMNKDEVDQLSNMASMFAPK